MRKILYLLNLIIPKSQNKIVFIDGRPYPDNIWSLVKVISPLFKKSIYIRTHRNIKSNSIAFCKFKCYGSISSWISILSAKYIISDIHFADGIITKKQIIINTWHGVGFKKILGTEKKIKNRRSLYATYATAYSNYFIDITTKIFLIPQENVLAIGSPRVDFLFNEHQDKMLFQKIGIDSSKFNKIAIWMPTYRQSKIKPSEDDGRYYRFGIPLIKSVLDIKRLNQFLITKGICLIIKFHALQGLPSELFDFSNVKIITTEDIIKSGEALYSFIALTDALITDYSSIYFEYLTLDRPVCFAFDDFDEYNNKRGFLFGNQTKDLMVGEKASNLIELEEFFNNLSMNNDICRQQREKQKSNLSLFCDNKNSERFVVEFKKILCNESNK